MVSIDWISVSGMELEDNYMLGHTIVYIYKKKKKQSHLDEIPDEEHCNL